MVTHALMEVQMVKRIAMLFGVVFLLVGVLGLFLTPAGMQMGIDPAAKPLLGLFPVNLLHNAVHIFFGVWGLMAARSFAGAAMYAKTAGIIYLILGVLGIVAPTTFGLIPIGGNDVWLHCAIGLTLAGVGYTARDESAPAATAAA
jgi:hypothetical protein